MKNKIILLLIVCAMLAQFTLASSMTGITEYSVLDSGNGPLFVVNSSGTVQVGNRSVEILTINESIIASGTITAGTDICINGSTCLGDLASPGLWTQTNNNLTYTAGRVGIGITAPEFTLQVGGNIGPEQITQDDLGTSSRRFTTTRTKNAKISSTLSIGGFLTITDKKISSTQDISFLAKKITATNTKVFGSVIQATNITATLDACITGGTCLSALTPIWTKTNNNLSHTAGSVGIGTTDVSDFTLQVNGSIGPSSTNTYDIGSWAQFQTSENVSAVAEAVWYGEVVGGSAVFIDSSGDVNGDGYDDIVVGAWNATNEGGSRTGTAYLIFGKSNGWSQLYNNLSNADVRWYGENITGIFGDQIEIVGDVNGDGYDDIMIGSRWHDFQTTTNGKTYLILGKASGWESGNISTVADASWYGESVASNLGGEIGRLGDVNGDGFADVLLGAFGNRDAGTDAGKAYLVLGKASGWTTNNNISTEAIASWYAEAPDDRLGFRGGGFGDVNGDGYNDFIIGAYLNDYGGSDSGKAYLIFGKANGWTTNNNITEVADASWYGENATDNLAYENVNIAGDVNGDGYDDILLGARYGADIVDDEGKAYLIFGKANGWTTNVNVSDAANASWYGGTSFDYFGKYGKGMGDLNKDGYDDIAIGGDFVNFESTFNTGAVYLLFGKPSGWTTNNVITSLANVSLFEDQAEQFLLRSSSGDLNGDGYIDLVVSSQSDYFGTNAGAIYIIFSNPLQYTSTHVQNTSISSQARIGKELIIESDTINSSEEFTLSGTTIFIESDTHVSEFLYTSGNINVSGDICIIGGNCVSTMPTAWVTSGNDLLLASGNVGINTATPTFKLEVGGDIGPNGTAQHTLGMIGFGGSENNLSTEIGFYGEQSGDTIGEEIAYAGDVNGDGYGDILIGAESTTNGTVYLIFGSANGWSGDINLSNANASFIGEASADGAGRSVAGVGDVNNDSYDDFIIGATGWGSFEGQVYLILGRPSGWSTGIDLGVGSNASWQAEGANEIAGSSAAGVGDVNADGYDDFVIGAYGYSAGANQGQVYLVLGRSAGWSMDQNLGTATNASWIGEASAERLGTAVTGLGDVNADGYDDFAMAAERSGDGGSFAGEAYLIFGRATGWSMDQAVGTTSNASFVGEPTGGDGIEMEMSGGDVNGDGYNDILITMPRNNQEGSLAGKAYLVFGRQDGWTLNYNLSKAAANWVGELASDEFGKDGEIVGDTNNDGYDDIILGASGNDDGGNLAGKAYLILGKGSGWKDDGNSSLINISWVGEANNNGAGYRVSSAGDFNNDGYQDLLISAYQNDNHGDNAGKVYVILSKERTFSDVFSQNISLDKGILLDTIEIEGNQFIKEEILINTPTVRILGNLSFADSGTMEDNATCTIVRSPEGDIGLEVCNV